MGGVARLNLSLCCCARVDARVQGVLRSLILGCVKYEYSRRGFSGCGLPVLARRFGFRAARRFCPSAAFGFLVARFFGSIAGFGFRRFERFASSQSTLSARQVATPTRITAAQQGAAPDRNSARNSPVIARLLCAVAAGELSRSVVARYLVVCHTF
jgi:hypothetical protein